MRVRVQTGCRSTRNRAWPTRLRSGISSPSAVRPCSRLSAAGGHTASHRHRHHHNRTAGTWSDPTRLAIRWLRLLRTRRRSGCGNRWRHRHRYRHRHHCLATPRRAHPTSAPGVASALSAARPPASARWQMRRCLSRIASGRRRSSATRSAMASRTTERGLLSWNSCRVGSVQKESSRTTQCHVLRLSCIDHRRLTQRSCTPELCHCEPLHILQQLHAGESAGDTHSHESRKMEERECQREELPCFFL